MGILKPEINGISENYIDTVGLSPEMRVLLHFHEKILLKRKEYLKAVLDMKAGMDEARARRDEVYFIKMNDEVTALNVMTDIANILHESILELKK